MATTTRVRYAAGPRLLVLALCTVAATLLALIGALPASADPTGDGSDSSSSAAPSGAGDPGTAADAKAAWDQAQVDAEAAAESLNGANEAKTAADTAAASAAAAKTAADAKATAAEQTAEQAAAAAAGYQGKLDQFASATARGARLGSMSLLLTADSADDFLDQASALQQVATDTQNTMAAAVAAKDQAIAALTAAKTAQTDADAAATAAQQAADSATAAQTAAEAKKTDLDTAVTKYQDLYNKLDAQEKAAAAAAAAQERADSAARAQALAAQQATAAQAPAAGVPGGETTAADTTTTAAAAPLVSGGDSLGQIAANAALTKVGGGYCYACNGPSSFDCSGLTTWAWGQAGISIPRTSGGQAAAFPQVPLDQLQPGDLVTYYQPTSHVAIYVGDGMVVSAATESVGIVLRPVTGAGPHPVGHRVNR